MSISEATAILRIYLRPRCRWFSGQRCCHRGGLARLSAHRHYHRLPHSFHRRGARSEMKINPIFYNKPLTTFHIPVSLLIRIKKKRETRCKFTMATQTWNSGLIPLAEQDRTTRGRFLDKSGSCDNRGYTEDEKNNRLVAKIVLIFGRKSMLSWRTPTNSRWFS